MEQFKVTDDVSVKALGPDEAEDAVCFIVFDDYPDAQSVPVFAHEIKPLIAALTEAAVWLADQASGSADAD